MKTDKNQFIEILENALDIGLIPGEKLPQIYRESILRSRNGLYLLCSAEENAEKPFLKANYAFIDSFDNIRLQGKELTLEEAAEYLKEKRANPLRVEERIKRVKRILDRKGKMEFFP